VTGQYIWEPTAEYVDGTQLQAVMRRLNVNSNTELHSLSIETPAMYWAATLNEMGIRWVRNYSQFVDLSSGPEWPRWFVGGQLNIVDSAVSKWAQSEIAQKPAIIWHDELARSQAISFAELDREWRKLAAALTSCGIGRGDTVGLFLPMCIEAVIAMLGVAAIGAIGVPMFSGYGDMPVATRLRDSAARLLITADGFTRKGRPVQMKEVADRAVFSCPLVETVIVVRQSGSAVSMTIDRDVWWDDLLAGVVPEDAAAIPVDPNDPMLLIYTSGTTGRPKGTIHPHCGLPLKIGADMAQTSNLDTQSRSLFWVDFGWVAGPGFLLGNLLAGATSVIYSGAPDFPSASRVWELIEKTRPTHMWLPPTLARTLRAANEAGAPGWDLTSLRVLCSTGEPWDDDTYRWYSRVVGEDRLPISNFAGGTEIGGAILGCLLNQPIKVSSFNAVLPGMAAAIFDEGGQPIVGRIGELVITQPFVGMTQGFWHDPDRYIDAYWSRVPGVWVHGDWAEVDKDGFWFVRGRSDDTIKVGGRRVGPAEIEQAAIACDGVRDAVAIGVPDSDSGSAIVLLVVPDPTTSYKDPSVSDGLNRRLTQHLTAALGRSLVPKAIHLVDALPYTRTGKLMRRLVRNAYLNADLGDTSAVDDPTVIDAVKTLRPSQAANANVSIAPTKLS
jgi:acetyl-CoA synthetase